MRRPVPSWALVAAALAVGGWLGYSIVGTKASEQAAVNTAVEFAAPLASVCATDPGVAAGAGADCPQAQAVAATQAVVTGPAGRGISGTAIVMGRLIVTYDDGTRLDLGAVAGRTGTPGTGITGSAIVDGSLILTFSDGQTRNVGRIVGEPGRGVASLAVVEGRLIVTYNDGTTQDAGALPAGPAGPSGAPGETVAGPAGPIGPPGPPPASWTYTDAMGTSHTCSRDSGSPDEAATYTCD